MRSHSVDFHLNKVKGDHDAPPTNPIRGAFSDALRRFTSSTLRQTETT